MNNIQIGKCIKDIPIDKIYEGMRIAVTDRKTANSPIELGKVLLVVKDSYQSIVLSNDNKNYIPYGSKASKILFKFDNECVGYYAHKDLINFYYVEEGK